MGCPSPVSCLCEVWTDGSADESLVLIVRCPSCCFSQLRPASSTRAPTKVRRASSEHSTSRSSLNPKRHRLFSFPSPSPPNAHRFNCSCGCNRRGSKVRDGGQWGKAKDGCPKFDDETPKTRQARCPGWLGPGPKGNQDSATRSWQQMVGVGRTCRDGGGLIATSTTCNAAERK